MDDVYATTPDQLVEQFGKGLIETLLRFAEGRDHLRLADAFAEWKNGNPLTLETKQLLWAVVSKKATPPPRDPAHVVRIIVEDRVYREGRVLRLFPTEARSSPSPHATRKEDMATATRKRVDENSIIHVITEDRKNPKREGSQAYGRFALYEDGMTVKEAKEAGVQAVDIAYDLDHEFISLTPGEAPADEEQEAEAAPAPKKKSAGKGKGKGGGKKAAAAAAA